MKPELDVFSITLKIVVAAYSWQAGASLAAGILIGWVLCELRWALIPIK